MNRYYEKSLMERRALTNLIPLLTSKYDWKLYLTPAEGYEKYDAIIIRFEKGTSKALEQFIIECKVRDIFYPTLLLESKKLNALKKIRKDMDERLYGSIKTGILYLSVTPNGSYLFDLDNITPEWVEEMHNISTVYKSSGKVMKKIAYLDINSAKRFEITTADAQEKPHDDIKEVIINQEQSKCLFDVLTTLNKN